MILIDTVLVKIASRCNLACSYCYVFEMGDQGWRSQPKLMSLETIDALALRLAELAEAQARPFSIVFHGGEPLLVGAARLDSFCRALRARLPSEASLSVQTNGVLLDDDMIAVLVEHEVGVSVSLDGPAQIHDRWRPDLRGRPTHARATAGIARLTAHPRGKDLFSGVLGVIDLASDPVEVYSTLKSTGAPSIDLLYRDGNRERLPFGKSSLVSVEYGEWMVRLLDHYLADRDPVPVRVLDDMLKLLLGGIPTKEGVGTDDFGILVVDTDGSVSKNDTLKSAFDGADSFGRVRATVKDDLVGFLRSSEYSTYHAGQRQLASECLACPDLKICGGGMPAHRWDTLRGYDNPTVFCSDQRHLVAHMRDILSRRSMAA